MSSPQQPAPDPSRAAGDPSARALHQALRRVRRRLRALALLQGAVRGGVLALGLVLGAVLAHRLGVRSITRGLPLPVASGVGAALLLLGGLASGLRRLDDLAVAHLVDRTHRLEDRLGSALQFLAAPPPAEADLTALLRQLAIRDAVAVADSIQPALAAPWRRPAQLPWLLGLLLLLPLCAYLRLPRRSPPPPPPPQAAAAEPRITVEPELLGPEREELEALLRSEDPELREVARELQRLLDQLARGELTRQEAFDKLAELEQRLLHGEPGALEDLRERLRRAGREAGTDKLTKELGAALEKEDLEKARKELERLAKQLERGGAEARAQQQALAQALERAARALDKKDEWQEHAKTEQQKAQELEEEERRLKKKLEQQPEDQDSVRRLKKVQRELERLQRERQQREEARRELERLQRDMQKAAEEMQRQIDKLSPEQRQALEQLMKDLNRMQDEIRKLQKQGQAGQQGQQGQQGQGQGSQGRQQAPILITSIKQVLRRAARSTGGPGQGQQGQGQQGQGQGGAMKDFLKRAKGQGQGDTLVEGEGKGKGDQRLLILGQGDTPVIMPGLGEPQGAGQAPGGGPDRGDQSPPGTEHDPNLLGAETRLDGKRRLTRLRGKEAEGPTRSETILTSAERGFATRSYQRVYHDYVQASEQALSRERLPPGYRFYIKRYFQIIKPRE